MKLTANLYLAKVKNTQSHASILPYILMAWLIIKLRNNFTFTYTRTVQRATSTV
jgi:hypothetical protein